MMTMLAFLASSDELTPTAKVVFGVIGLILFIAVIVDNSNDDTGPCHF
jgi:hypothetical protein